MKFSKVFRLRTVLAFVTGGVATLFFSILLETFLFRPLVKSRPDLFPWNRELNAVALLLAAFIGGVVAVHTARSFSLWTLTKDEEENPELLVVFAAVGAATMLWLLSKAVSQNPLTVGWRGILMATASAAAGGAMLVGGRARWVALGVLLITLVVGFGTANYDFYSYSVAIPSERVLLQGEVLVPGRSADATYPGVVLVHDWGQQDRNGTWGVNKPFRELAEHLARNGYVVLRYDKRGSGQSSGVFTQHGLADFARDVVSAGTVLATQREVRNEPIFAVGHGFGGQAITIAAREQPELFAGLALLNTSASPTADLLRYQHRYSLAEKGASEGEIERRMDALDEWINGVRDRRYLNYGDYFGNRGIAEELQAEQLETPLPPAWLRQAEAHDEPSALAKIALPVLILSSGADWLVPQSEAELLADALAASDHPGFEIRLLPGLNHRFVRVDDVAAAFRLEQSSDYLEQRRPVAPVVLDALTDWLNRARDPSRTPTSD